MGWLSCLQPSKVLDGTLPPARTAHKEPPLEAPMPPVGEVPASAPSSSTSATSSRPSSSSGSQARPKQARFRPFFEGARHPVDADPEADDVRVGPPLPPSTPSQKADSYTAGEYEDDDDSWSEQSGGAAEYNAGHTGADPLCDNDVWRKVKDVNRGASGFVQLVENKLTGEQLAIKFIQTTDSRDLQARVIERELLNHRLCATHPHIVQLREIFHTGDHLAIAMEYAAGGDLADYVYRYTGAHVPGIVVEKGIPEEEARWFFQQLAVAVDYCHQLGIANRDIKMENVLLDNTQPRPLLKLCDFGYSKDEQLESICKTEHCGTPEYMAPEVILSCGGGYDGKMADVWSCGVMLYVMLAGVFPFLRPGDEFGNCAQRMTWQFPRILKADYVKPTGVSEESLDLLARLLTPDPVKRITIAEILGHPWFLTDLPEGLLEVNARVRALPEEEKDHACRTSREQISEISQKCIEGFTGHCNIEDYELDTNSLASLSFTIAGEESILAGGRHP